MARNRPYPMLQNPERDAHVVFLAQKQGLKKDEKEPRVSWETEVNFFIQDKNDMELVNSKLAQGWKVAKVVNLEKHPDKDVRALGPTLNALVVAQRPVLQPKAKEK